MRELPRQFVRFGSVALRGGCIEDLRTLLRRSPADAVLELRRLDA